MKMGKLTMTKYTRSKNNIFVMNTFLIKVVSESVIFNNNILTLGLPNNFVQDDQIFPNQITCYRMDYDTEALIQAFDCAVEDYDNEFKEVKYIRVTNICGQAICGAAYKVAVKMQ